MRKNEKEKKNVKACSSESKNVTHWCKKEEIGDHFARDIWTLTQARPDLFWGQGFICSMQRSSPRNRENHIDRKGTRDWTRKRERERERERSVAKIWNLRSTLWRKGAVDILLDFWNIFNFRLTRNLQIWIRWKFDHFWSSLRIIFFACFFSVQTWLTVY